MAKEDVIKLEGLVTEALGNASFRIDVGGFDNPVIGVISGKMRQNNIKVLPGDKVEIEFSPYDLSRGRITRRR